MYFNNKLISDKIIASRLAKNMTQKELAKLLAIKPNTLSAIECGREVPSINILIGISKILNVTVDSLLDNNVNFLNDEKYIDVNNKIHLEFYEALKNASSKQKIELKNVLFDYMTLKKYYNN